mgnify:CR=1 FL=1
MFPWSADPLDDDPDPFPEWVWTLKFDVKIKKIRLIVFRELLYNMDSRIRVKWFCGSTEMETLVTREEADQMQNFEYAQEFWVARWEKTVQDSRVIFEEDLAAAEQALLTAQANLQECHRHLEVQKLNERDLPLVAQAIRNLPTQAPRGGEVSMVPIVPSSLAVVEE